MLVVPWRSPLVSMPLLFESMCSPALWQRIQGIIEGKAHEILRYRRELGTETAILADVLVKHALPLAKPNLSITVQDTIQRGLADAVILSGDATGHPPI